MNIMKRKLSVAGIIIAVAMCFAMMGVLSQPAHAGVDITNAVEYDSQTAIGNYTIDSEAQLRELATRVNSGTTYADSTFTMTGDIALSSSWTPIGTSSHPFMGNFNGNGKTVSGLSMSSTASYQGLFGRLHKAYVENLTVSGSITASDSPQYIGGIVGYTDSSVFNCTSNVTIITGKSAVMVGGIAGAVENLSGTTVKVCRCTNNAEIDAGRRVGGIVGAVYCTDAGKVIVDQCVNNQAITAQYSSKVWSGGIVGYCRGYIANCINNGDVRTVNEDAHYIGGIAGLLQGSDPMAGIANCYNKADVGYYKTQGEPYIVLPGYMQALFSSCDKSSDLKVQNCYWLDTGNLDQASGTGWGAWTNSGEIATASTTAKQFKDKMNAANDLTVATGKFKQATDSDSILPLLNDEVAAEEFLAIGDNTAYLDGAAAVNGTGTYELPCNTVANAKAAADAKGVSTIYLTGTVRITADQSLAGGYTFKRSSMFDGIMFDVQAGTLSVYGTVDGNSFGNSYSYSPMIHINNGALALYSGGVLQNNRAYSGGAVRVTEGTFTMNAGEIKDNMARNYGGAVQLAGSGGSFVLKGGTISGNTAGTNKGSAVSCFSDGFRIDSTSASVSGVVYLDKHKSMSVTSLPSSMTVTVVCEDPAIGRLIAKSESNTSGQFAYSGGGYKFSYNIRTKEIKLVQD